MAPGFFIVFEGGDGVGKSTQIARLRKNLQRQGLKVAVTFEPGGTHIGNRIRSVLLDHSSKSMSPLAELFLYEASRAQHVKEVVRPLLAKGFVVISDRFEDSSTVYQGSCRGIGETLVRRLNQIATGGLKPDLVVVLDTPVKVSLKRLSRKRVQDRLEKEKASFHKKVRSGFLRLARRDPRRYVVISGLFSKEEIAQQITEAVRKRSKLWKKG